MQKTQQKDTTEWLEPYTNAPTDWLQERTADQQRYRAELMKWLTPRLPTEQEIQEVVDYLLVKLNMSEQDRYQLEAFYDGSVPRPIAVFDHYETNTYTYKGNCFSQFLIMTQPPPRPSFGETAKSKTVKNFISRSKENKKHG